MIVVVLSMLLGVFLVLTKVKMDKRTKENLPPGPWGFPFVGHFPLIGLDPITVVKKWKQKYGPMVYCRFGSFPTVILSDSKLIKEAFQIPELGGRPNFRFIEETKLKNGMGFSDAPINTELRHFTLTYFKEFGVGQTSFDGLIHEGVSEFLNFIKRVEGLPVNSTEIPSSHIMRSLWSVLVSQHFIPEELEKIRCVLENKFMRLQSPISELAGFMPWMDKLVYLLSFGQISLTKSRVEGTRELLTCIEGLLLNKLNKTDEQIKGPQSRAIMELFLDKQQKTTNVKSAFHISHGASVGYAFDLLVGGLHTSYSLQLWALYYIAANQRVQKKLQDEIDLMIHSCRLPALEDREQMPYTETILLELLRISSIAPFLVPHKALKDVHFHGYTIKKGTLIFGDGYGVHHDENVWGDPDVFRPERWEGEEGKMLKNERFLAFSTGRRRCPGDRLAMNQLFLYVTTLCQRYSLDLHGEKSKQVRGVYGLTYNPSAFQVVFTSRSGNDRGNSIA